MTTIDESNIDKVRHRQRVRAAMRKHGLTEVVEHMYSKGDIIGNKMAYVVVRPAPNITDEELDKFALWIAGTYDDLVKEGPKP